MDYDQSFLLHDMCDVSFSLEIILLALATGNFFHRSFKSSIFAPGILLLMKKFGSSHNELALSIVSIFILGFCICSLVIAPFSKVYERSPVIHASDIILLIFKIACTVSFYMGLFVSFRFCQELSGCPP